MNVDDRHPLIRNAYNAVHRYCLELYGSDPCPAADERIRQAALEADKALATLQDALAGRDTLIAERDQLRRDLHALRAQMPWLEEAS